jgi:hypothetical protein
MYVPKNEDLRRLIMEEAHRAHYFEHPRVNKMHVDAGASLAKPMWRDNSVP